MCLSSSKLFLLLFKSSLLSLTQNFRVSSSETLEKYQKSGGKRPYNSSICILVLLCNVIQPFSFHIDSVSSTVLQTCQDKFLLSLVSFLYTIHMQKPLSGTGSCLHDIFEMFQEASVPPMARSYVCKYILLLLESFLHIKECCVLKALFIK